jgi:OCT family organic cation transporter-like MFS transporter 4/5
MATTYTYLSELFPTVVRSLAVGLISGAGTVGSITCPFVVTFANHLGISPLIPLGVIGLLGAASVIPLKETLG